MGLWETVMSDDLITRLSTEAALQSEWHAWELGKGPAPAVMYMSRTADLLREAIVEITRLRERTEWRDIATAPKDGTIIHIADARDVHAAFWDADRDAKFPWRFMDNDEESAMNAWMDGKHGPTHWLPLPPPPGDKT
jgi:hypothetical protein